MSRLLNEDFVAKYKNSFSEGVLSNAFTQKSTLTGKELLHLTPSRQLNFFVMKVLYKQWQDEMKRLESPYFNYRNPEVRRALMQFMNALSQHIEVEEPVLKELLSSALDDCFLLITSPADFIHNEFKGRETQEYSEKHAKSFLKYIKVLNEEFDDFFHAQAKGTYTDVFEIATDYFADVDLTSAQESVLADLSKVDPISMESMLAEEELVDVIDFDEEIEETKDEPEQDSEPADEVQHPKEVESVDNTPSEEVEESKAEEVVPEPKVEITTELEEPDSVENEADQSVETVNDQFQKDNTSLVDHLEESGKVDTLMSSISVNQQYMFAQELFGGDANTFQKAISELEDMTSFDDSVEHLVSQYAKKNDWDMNSDEVKELLKVIFRRFR